MLLNKFSHIKILVKKLKNIKAQEDLICIIKIEFSKIIWMWNLMTKFKKKHEKAEKLWHSLDIVI